MAYLRVPDKIHNLSRIIQKELFLITLFNRVYIDLHDWKFKHIIKIILEKTYSSR